MAALHEVEATAVATFTSTGMFHVRYDEATVAYLPIEFLHDGVPQLELESEWRPPQLTPFNPPTSADHSRFWKACSSAPTLRVRKHGSVSTTMKSLPRRRSNPSLVWNATAVRCWRVHRFTATLVVGHLVRYCTEVF